MHCYINEFDSTHYIHYLWKYKVLVHLCKIIVYFLVLFFIYGTFSTELLIPPPVIFYRKSLTSVTSAEKPLTGVQPSTRTHASMRDTNHSCASSVGRDFTKKVRR